MSVQTQGEIPTVNGVELTDRDAVCRAFNYLGKEYNDGDIVKDGGLDGEVTILVSRSSNCEHWTRLKEAMIAGYIDVSTVSATNDGRAKVEIRDVDTE